MVRSAIFRKQSKLSAVVILHGALQASLSQTPNVML